MSNCRTQTGKRSINCHGSISVQPQASVYYQPLSHKPQSCVPYKLFSETLFRPLLKKVSAATLLLFIWLTLDRLWFPPELHPSQFPLYLSDVISNIVMVKINVNFNKDAEHSEGSNRFSICNQMLNI